MDWGVGEGGWVTFDGFEEVAGCFQAGVGAVIAFGGEAHGGAVGAAGVGLLVVAEVAGWLWILGGKGGTRDLRSAAMPCQSDNHRTVAAVIVIIFLLQQLGNLIVHFLVVLLLWCEHASCLARTAFLHFRDASIVEIEIAGATGSCQGSERCIVAGS